MNVRDFLTRQGVDFEVIQHAETFDAQHMAHEIHVSGHQVAKTVLLRADGGYRHFLAVLPASARVDLRLLQLVLGGSRVELATESEVGMVCRDCQLGAIPPFGSFFGVQTMLDRSLQDHDWIVFEGNSHRESIRMRLCDFIRLESPLITDFAVSAGPNRLAALH
jgi:Ala-tRNA(Pro) deacylase